MKVLSTAFALNLLCCSGIVIHRAKSGDRPALLLSVWLLPTERLPTAVDECADAFESAQHLLQSLPGRDVDTVLVHNTLCSSTEISSNTRLSAVSVPTNPSLHVWDYRWVWYNHLLSALEKAAEGGTSVFSCWPHSRTVLTGPVWASSAAYTYLMIMDVTDARLLGDPAPFFAAHPAYDLFIGEEATATVENPWMMDRFTACFLNPTSFEGEKILNAGVIGGVSTAIRLLVTDVVRGLEDAISRAGEPCTSLGIDMILVNAILRAKPTQFRVHVGAPFLPTFQASGYTVIVVTSTNKIGSDLYSLQKDCGCEYAPRMWPRVLPYWPLMWTPDELIRAQRAWERETSLVCYSCLPFLATHKVGLAVRIE